MYRCFIGAEDAKYLSEGLAKNEGLTSQRLKCAASHPTPYNRVPFLCVDA